MKHGASAYRHNACRCAECKADHHARVKAERHARMVAGVVHPPHGTPSTYANYLCRCDACMAAYSARNARNHLQRKHNAHIAATLKVKA